MRASLERALWLASSCFLLALAGCSDFGPSEERVLSDFRNEATKAMGETIRVEPVEVFSGEGDAENVYKHIRFEAIALGAGAKENAWLASSEWMEGDRFASGEVILLYQHRESDWTYSSVMVERAATPK